MTGKRKKSLKLKPSVRDKRRYIIIDSASEKAEKAILDYVGILGFAKSSFKKVYKKDLEKNIISVKRESLENVKAGLTLAGINIQKISGTLKGLVK